MRNRLLVCLAILFLTFLIEFFGGIYTRSLSLVSDSFHVLSDLFTLALSYLTLLIALRKVPTDKMTYGYHRLEVFSALINGVTLVGIALWMILKAVDRMKSPQPVLVFPALEIAIFGFWVNLLCAFILHRTREKKDLNFRSAYLHLVADTFASISVILGILLIHWTGKYIVDSLVAIALSLWILISAVRVLAGGAGILLQQSPHELDKIRKKVREIPGIIDLEDIRLWQVCSNLIVGTAHVITNVSTLKETEEISVQIKTLLQNQFNICHMTLQFESPEMAERHSHEFEHWH